MTIIELRHLLYQYPSEHDDLEVQIMLFDKKYEIRAVELQETTDQELDIFTRELVIKVE